MKYEQISLSEVCDLIAGFAFKSKHFGNYRDKVIKIANITPPSVSMSDLVGVDISYYNSSKLERFTANVGDYVLAMSGATICKIGRIEVGQAYINQRVLLFRNHEEKIDKDFLYYVLQQYEFEQYVKGHIDSESAQPNISAGTIGKYQFCLPSMDLQKRIGRTLRMFDEKIELNSQINENLQEQAQAIYSNMFICNASEQWTDGILSDVAEITMGQSPKGDTYNENGVGTVFFQGRGEFGFRFPTRRLFTTDPKRMAQSNDVLMSVRAPVGDLNVAYEPCCIGRGLGAIRSKDSNQSFVLYTAFSLREKLDMFNGEGTVFGSINRDALNSMPIIIPTKEEMDRFEEIVAPMDAAIRNNYEEICRLEAIRDSLLPRLMSGQLDVSNLDL